MNRGYTVTVCDTCFRAACWHGDHPCATARTAGTREVLASELDARAVEHPSWYAPERLRITGVWPAGAQ